MCLWFQFQFQFQLSNSLSYSSSYSSEIISIIVILIRVLLISIMTVLMKKIWHTVKKTFILQNVCVKLTRNKHGHSHQNCEETWPLASRLRHSYIDLRHTDRCSLHIGGAGLTSAYGQVSASERCCDLRIALFA